MYYDFVNAEERKALQSWHRWLDGNRGDRARLRRAERPEDVLLTKGFFNFLDHMPESWLVKKPVFSSAVVAGLLSHVESDSQVLSRGYQPKDEKKPRNMASFAEQLATPTKGKKAQMSELRFQQLQKSRTTDDFYRRAIRAVRLLNGKVNIISLANDIVQWHSEFNRQVDREPEKRLAVRWASNYYTALQKNEK